MYEILLIDGVTLFETLNGVEHLIVLQIQGEVRYTFLQRVAVGDGLHQSLQDGSHIHESFGHIRCHLCRSLPVLIRHIASYFSAQSTNISLAHYELIVPLLHLRVCAVPLISPFHPVNLHFHSRNPVDEFDAGPDPVTVGMEVLLLFVLSYPNDLFSFDCQFSSSAGNCTDTERKSGLDDLESHLINEVDKHASDFTLCACLCGEIGNDGHDNSVNIRLHGAEEILSQISPVYSSRS